MQGIFKRWIVTAHSEHGPYRYMAEDEADAYNTARIYAEVGLDRISVRSVLWDTRKGVIV